MKPMKVNYTDIAANYDKHRSYSEKETIKLIEFGEIREGLRILDLGCGTGNVSSQIRNNINVDIIAADKSLPMLEVARGKSLEVLCIEAGADCLPFRDNTFDIAIAAYVIHQIDNLEAMFYECYRILKNGRLLIMTSSHRQIENQHPVLKRFFPSAIDIDKARFPDIPEVDRMLHKAGFRDIKHDDIHVEAIPLNEEYLQKVKGKFISTYHLIPQEEFELGVSRLEDYINNNRQPEHREWQGTLIRAEKDG